MNKEKELLKTAAQKMRQMDNQLKTHEKRAHALRLIYKQAELGYGDVPRSYSELQEKVASLVNQDLFVLEKALELTGGNIKLGELANSEPQAYNATEMFQAAILGD